MANEIDRESLREEIRRLRARYRETLSEAADAPSTWVLEERSLCWHVVLGDVAEPDIDIEEMHEALVVRARAESGMCQALVPVPGTFRRSRPRYAFRAEVLEIRFVL
ncbi:MAG: hypothetical protein ACYTGZ_02930 [Planctomycetota bacterium]